VIVEKGSEIGARILSGVVVDPIGLDKLLPSWREDPDRPLKTSVTEDKFFCSALHAASGCQIS
jgi:electron-transferring-flavoprotein dehydrogenase